MTKSILIALVMSSVVLTIVPSHAASLPKTSLLTQASQFAAGGKVSLNPQPIPPGERVGLNPQPIPPGDFVSLNPQPIPPKESFGKVIR